MLRLGDMEFRAFHGQIKIKTIRCCGLLRERTAGRPETVLIYRYPAGSLGAIYGQIAWGTRSEPCRSHSPRRVVSTPTRRDAQTEIKESPVLE